MAYRDAVLALNPLHFWDFQETTGTTATDYGTSATLSNGTYNSGCTVNQPGPQIDPSGTTGVSVSFDGTSNGFVDIPNVSDLNITGDWTISAWVYQTSQTNWGFILDKSDQSGANNIPYRTAITSSAQMYAMQNDWDRYSDVNLVTLNTWQLLTWRKSGGRWHFFRNGAFDRNDTIGSTPRTNTSDLLIGKLYNNTNIFVGSLAYPVIWNSGLSDQQISDLYAATRPGGNVRTTQVAAETIIAPQPNLRTTQVTAEAIVSPQSSLRTTQMVAEVIVAPLPQTPPQGQTIVIR